MIVNSTGEFLYVLDNYFDTITGYRIDHTTGALTPIPDGSLSLGDFGGARDASEMGMTIARVPARK